MRAADSVSKWKARSRDLRRPLTRSRRGIAPILLAVIVVIVAIVVVVGGLFAAGVLKLGGGGGGSPSTTYTVTFTESGLPSGTSWSVTLGGATSSSTTSTITFNEANGTYTYTVGTVSGYSASPSSGSVTVNGAAVSKSITFTSSSPSGQYAVTFSQTGLPSNVSWTAFVFTGSISGGGTPTLFFGTAAEGASFEFTAPNGQYYWIVSASNSSYEVTPSNGTITVSSAAVSVAVHFSVITPSTTSYAVTFTETGLPSGADWTVNMNSTSMTDLAGSPIVFSVPNGTYSYDVSTSTSGYGATVPSGDVTVNGRAVTVTVVFVREYTVTFTETGLPTGTSWTVELNVTFEYGYAGYASPTFTVPNGNYPFSVTAQGYSASPASGTITVNGAPVTKAITFTATVPPPMYKVTFTESGLPTGSSWYVTIFPNGVLLTQSYSNASTTTTLVISVPNGYYSWVVLLAPSGYVGNPMAGGFRMNGAALTQSIAFSYQPNVHLAFFAEYDYLITGANGIPNGTSWSVTMGGTTQSSSGMFIFFAEPNGTYSYTISGPAGFTPIPASGSFTINSPTTGAFLSGAASVYVAFSGSSPSAATASPIVGGSFSVSFLLATAAVGSVAGRPSP